MQLVSSVLNHACTDGSTAMSGVSISNLPYLYLLKVYPGKIGYGQLCTVHTYLIYV
jgi:hypothetical protein